MTDASPGLRVCGLTWNPSSPSFQTAIRGRFPIRRTCIWSRVSGASGPNVTRARGIGWPDSDGQTRVATTPRMPSTPSITVRTSAS